MRVALAVALASLRPTVYGSECRGERNLEREQRPSSGGGAGPGPQELFTEALWMCL